MTLYVGNIDFGLKEDELLAIFSEFGPVKSAKIIIDNETGRSKGFAFVEMTSDVQAEEAIKNLNGAEVNFRSLKVNEAKPKTSDSRGGFQGNSRGGHGGGNGGYNRGGNGGGYNGGGGGFNRH